MNELNLKIKELYRQGRNYIITFHYINKDVNVKTIWNFLCEFIHLAEKIIDLPNCGATKHQIVMELWQEANVEFKLTEKIANFIPDKIKIWKFNVPLKWIDVNAIIDKIVIPAIVLMAEKCKWGKNV